MKRKDATFTFRERYDDLNRAYKEALLRFNFSTQEQTMAHAVELPSCRFWVSAARLSSMIYYMETGDVAKCGNNPLRREMFQEMYRRYLELKNNPDNQNMTKTDLCYEVIYSQAPKFYMKPSWALKIFYKGRSKYAD